MTDNVIQFRRKKNPVIITIEFDTVQREATYIVEGDVSQDEIIKLFQDITKHLREKGWKEELNN